MGQVVAFLVAGAIFLATVSAVLVATSTADADPSAAQDAGKSVEAASLADLLVGSTGVGWEAGADGLTRLGLAAANGSGLDPASLEALRGALQGSTANGKVDYEDALVSLGMDPEGTEGFHIRVYPLGMDELEMSDDLDIAYIADWDALVGITLTPPVLSQEAMAVAVNARLNTTMVANTIYERQAIRALGADFTDRVYITAGTPSILVDFPWPISDKQLLTVLNVPLLEGDVYPDDKNYLETVLPNRLSQYDVIIVGAGVDHGNLVKDSIKDGIADWVAGGGTLIALGSIDKSTAWLDPLLKTGISTVNGAPVAPDIAHPLLKEPNDLAWTAYDSYDIGWDLQENGAKAVYDEFSHVVLQDGEDVLAVSKDGSFGDGRVILTTFRPREFAVSISLTEATNFLENMVSYADRSDYYLDYGGTIPTDVPVAMAVRQSFLWDEAFGQVPVRVEVLAWA